MASPRPARIAFGALWLAVLLVPIVSTDLSWLGLSRVAVTAETIVLPRLALLQILVAVSAAAWLWGLARDGGLFRTGPVLWLLLGFLAWALVSSLLAVHVPTALLGKYGRGEGLVTQVTCALTFFVALQVIDDAAKARRIAVAVVVGGALVSLYGLVQFLGLDPSRQGMTFSAQAIGTLGNPDLFGSYVVIPLALTPVLALTEKRIWARAGWWAALLVLAAALVVAFARGPWIGGVVALGVVAFAVWRSRPPLVPIADGLGAAAATTAAAAVAALSLRSSDEVANVGTRLATLVDLSGGSGLSRTLIWRAAVQAVGERPLLGWGLDTFERPFSRLRSAEFMRFLGVREIADNTHDLPLNLAAGTGLLGALLWTAAVAWALVSSARTAFTSRDEGSHLVYAGFWAAAFAYLLAMLVGISMVAGTSLLWVALGALLAPTAKSVCVRAGRFMIPIQVAAVVLALAVTTWAGFGLAADVAARRGRLATSTADRIRLDSLAAALQPVNDAYAGAVGLDYAEQMRDVLQQAAADQKAGRDPTIGLAQARGAYDAAVARLGPVAATDPYSVQALYILSVLYFEGAQSFNDPDAARAALTTAQKGARNQPRDPLMRRRLAEIAFYNGDRATALAAMGVAVALAPTDAELQLARASLLQATGDLRGAEAGYREVLKLQPGSPAAIDGLRSVEASLTPQS